MRLRRVLKNMIFLIMILVIVALVGTTMMFVVYRDRFQYPTKWKKKIYKPFSEGTKPDTSNLEFYDLNSSLHQRFECIQTRTVPSVYVCVYPIVVDKFISNDIRTTGLWEPHITSLLLEVLDADPSCVFLDLGSNVGYYSLLAAKSGHLVVSVEPDVDHVRRLHRGVELENLKDRIVVLRNAVADRRAVVAVRKSGDNQGNTQIEMELKECQGSCPPTVKSIVLNDLTYLVYDLTLLSTNRDETGIPDAALLDRLEYFRRRRDAFVSANLSPVDALGYHEKGPSNVVLKLDTQGFEHMIFDNPDFFFDRNSVTHIFMEWQLMARSHPNFNRTAKPPEIKTYGGQKDLGERDAVKVEIMIRFLSERNFRPYGSGARRVGEALDPATWNLWPNDVVWCHDTQWLFMARMGLKSLVG